MVCEENVNLSFFCANLPAECDQNIKIVVKAQLPQSSNAFVQIGETEAVRGSLDPKFSTHIPILVRVDLNQRLRFEIHKMNMDGSYNPIGRVDNVSLRSVTNSQSEMLFPLDPIPGKSALWELDESPLIGIEARYPEESNNGTLMQFYANNLYCDHVVELSTYFTISLIPTSISKFPILLYRSEVVGNTSSPKWSAFTIPTKYLSSPSHQTLEFVCYAFRFNHKNDVQLGKSSFTFAQLLSGQVSKFMLHSPGKHRREHTYVELVKFDRVPQIPNYLDVIKKGMKLHFTIAIDLTAKNGGPNDPTSLHYVHPNVMNAYAEALKDIAESVCPYDSQNRVLLKGFGAKFPPDFRFSNNFPLSGDPKNPYVKGVQNILQAYRQASMGVQFFAPVEYSEIIHDVIKMAKVAQDNKTNVYFVLIILTNGNIKQIEHTLNDVVQASEFPISILFAGISNTAHPIGGGDHSKLTQLLDSSLKSLSTNRPLKRQCTYFVEHEKSADNHAVRELLSIIPMQITQWLLLK